MIDIQEIRAILPHRYPFLLIDRVEKMDPIPTDGKWVGRKCETLKNVTVNEPHFMGHFPHYPIMPGVLIIEAMAQTCAVCAHRPPSAGVLMEVLIAAVDNAKFRKPVVPGDQLRIKVEMIKDRGSIMAFRCEGFVEGQLVAEADIMAKAFPRKTSA